MHVGLLLVESEVASSWSKETISLAGARSTMIEDASVRYCTVKDCQGNPVGDG